MQIVIKIDDELYERVIETVESSYDREIIANAIKDSTPLPKGHGRLIDADELKEHKYHDNHRCENAVAVAYIDWADTIIEADKGE